MKESTKAELLRRFSELTEGQKDEVLRYIEFILWKKKQEFLKNLTNVELIAELNSRQIKF